MSNDMEKNPLNDGLDRLEEVDIEITDEDLESVSGGLEEEGCVSLWCCSNSSG